jgi:surface antigen
MDSTGCVYGHVGIVTAVYPDGSIDTAETGAGFGANCQSTNHYTKADYEGKDVQFVYVGDSLK